MLGFLSFPECLDGACGSHVLLLRGYKGSCTFDKAAKSWILPLTSI